MYRHAVLPIFSRFDAEIVHERVLALLSAAEHVPLALPILGRLFNYEEPHLEVKLWNLRFRNPLGIAAGLDKNGQATSALLRLGWGHVEVGTITPLPQPGNPRPRIFRLSEDRALINRMGFPGAGADRVLARLAGMAKTSGIVGINIGANKQSVEAGTAIEDYKHGITRLGGVADYLTINVSSPNTARLRELQGREALTAVIEGARIARNALPKRKPLLVKIAPDLSTAELDDIIEICLTHDIDGIVATNTTIARPPSLQNRRRDETGGLSGAPLRSRSTEVIRYLYQGTEGKLPIIGVGGIFSAADALEKLAAGASLLQIYTAFIYEGPSLARRVNRDLSQLFRQHGIASSAELTGSAAR